MMYRIFLLAVAVLALTLAAPVCAEAAGGGGGQAGLGASFGAVGGGGHGSLGTSPGAGSLGHGSFTGSLGSGGIGRDVASFSPAAMAASAISVWFHGGNGHGDTGLAATAH